MEKEEYGQAIDQTAIVHLPYKKYKINIENIKTVEDVKMVFRIMDISLFTYANTDMMKEIDLHKDLFIEIKE